MENELLVLKGEPSVSDIETITDNYLSKDDHALQLKLQFVNVILQHILPVYQSLKTTLRLKIRRVFHSSIGVSNLLNTYKLTKNDIYLKFMKDLLIDQTLLVNTIQSAKGNRNELNQIKSLFVGSKIFQTFEGKIEMERYLDLITKQLVEVCKDGSCDISDFICPFLSLHPIDAKFVFFNQFFTDSYFNYAVELYSKMSRLNKRSFLLRYLIPYMERHTTVNNTETVAKILKHFEFSEYEDQAIARVSESRNADLQQAISVLIKDPKSSFEVLLKLWGNEQFIKDTPSDIQESTTRELLILLNNVKNSTDSDSIARDRTFLDAITSRISSDDTFYRNLGMMVAKEVTNGEIKFDIEDEIKIQEIPTPDFNSKINFTDLHINDSMKNLSLSSHKETKIADSDDESELEDDEDQEEVETLFLKDLIKKFNDEKLNSITKLLSHTIKLVRQKATFKLEIEFYSEELISLLVGLINKYEEPNFEELKINSIVSIIVVNPKVVPYIMNLLFTGDYSLQQRMVILSSISLSARELRGLEDEFIDKPQFDFPTRKIEQRHQPQIEEIDNGPAKIEEIKEDENPVGQGTVLRKSSKLTKPKSHTKPNNFAKLAPKFFYPLANGWIQGINIGNYNQLFMKHYLQTLGLVVEAAHPCHEFEDMATLYNEILENSQNIVL